MAESFTTETHRIVLGAGTKNERRIDKGATITRAELEADGCQVDPLVRAGLLKAKGKPAAADK